MFYNIIKYQRLICHIDIINIFLLISFGLTFSSCVTSEMNYVTPDLIESGTPGIIKKIDLKNGNSINCNGKLVKIEKGFDSTGLIIIETIDTIKAGSSVYVYKNKWNELRIPERDVLKVYLENSKVDGLKTGLLGLSIIAASFIVFLVLNFAVIAQPGY